MEWEALWRQLASGSSWLISLRNPAVSGKKVFDASLLTALCFLEANLHADCNMLGHHLRPLLISFPMPETCFELFSALHDHFKN